MSLFACEQSTHQGLDQQHFSERSRGRERFICVWLLYLKLTPGWPFRPFNCKIIWLSRWQAPATQATFKSKENFSSTTLNPLISMRRYLCTSIRDSAKTVDIVEQWNKISCLSRDSSLNRSWSRWNFYFLRQIKKSKKYKQAITKNAGLMYHLLALWKFTRRAFLF